jgi:hypothetical protein
MKKLVFLLSMTFLSTCLLAQSSEMNLTGALGLAFGMNSASTKPIMTNKGGEFYKESTKSIIYTKVPIGTKTADMVILQFVNDKLHTVKAVFFVEVEAKTQGLYDELQTTLTNKYGKPESYRHFDGAYSDGDGYEMQAIREGHGSIDSYWNFKDNNTISLEISNLKYDMHVAITYQDSKLIKEAIAKDDAKDKTEF